jgi:hypothetical protein
LENDGLAHSVFTPPPTREEFEDDPNYYLVTGAKEISKQCSTDSKKMLQISEILSYNNIPMSKSENDDVSEDFKQLQHEMEKK